MKKFEEIYNEIMDSDAKEFIKKRKIFTMLAFIIYPAFIMFLISSIKQADLSLTNLGIIIFGVFGIFIITMRAKMVKEYKKKIISKFLKSINESFDIYPEKGIDSKSYKQSGFKMGNKYSATDLIVGKLENDLLVQMSDINVKDERKSEDGTKIENLLFKGLFLRVDFKNKIDKPIKLLKNEKRLMKNNLKIDNPDFEKIYDIYAENELQAFQLYTLDVMEKLLKFKEKNKLCPEIIVKESDLYIRIAAEQLFEPTVTGFDFDKERLELYYEIIKLVDEISNHLLNTIMNEIL